ncbi:hypothetical protein LINGRAHAP2_LOCUS34677 [Linum grandiflorum]
MKRVFDTYAVASGQLINFDKSEIYFSRLTDPLFQAGSSIILGVNWPLNTSRYLGMPSLIGRKKKVVFNFVK